MSTGYYSIKEIKKKYEKDMTEWQQCHKSYKKKEAVKHITDDNNITLLCYVIYLNDFEAVKFLVDHGVDVNKLDFAGKTPLVRAIYTAWAKGIEFLLEHGADINKQIHNGKTPLMIALKITWDDTIFKLILEHCADVNIKNKKGNTALHYAASTCNENTIRLIADKVADINAQNNKGETALHIIAGYSFLENFEPLKLIQMLIDNYKADSSIKDKSGSDAYDIYRFITKLERDMKSQ